MNSGKVLLGLLAGVSAGALLGVLFAPEKGSETRKKILQKGEGYADALKDKFNTLIDSVTEKFETVQEDMSGFTHKGQSQSNGTDKAKSAIL